MKDERLYLIHIAECIQRIESYPQEGRNSFMQSSMTQDAVIRNFEVMGEAAKRVSQGLRKTYPDVPWHRIGGFRDVLIHDYIRVDPDEVWNIVERELPDLKRKVLGILEGLG